MWKIKKILQKKISNRSWWCFHQVSSNACRIHSPDCEKSVDHESCVRYPLITKLLREMEQNSWITRCVKRIPKYVKGEYGEAWDRPSERQKKQNIRTWKMRSDCGDNQHQHFTWFHWLHWSNRPTSSRPSAFCSCREVRNISKFCHKYFDTVPPRATR